MSEGRPVSSDVSETQQSTDPTPKVWGRRTYATAGALELLNDISRWVARERPDDVDDPDDPSLDDVIRSAPAALPRGGDDPKGAALSMLMGDYGLDFQQAVVWYWFRFCGMDLNQIHGAITGVPKGGHPDQRRDSYRDIVATLRAAAMRVPDADPSDIPDLSDQGEQ